MGGRTDGESEYLVLPEDLTIEDGIGDGTNRATDTVIFVKSLTNETITILVDLDETVFQTRKAIEGHSLMSRLTQIEDNLRGGTVGRWEDP